jgi:hypothetical protein
MPKGDIGSMSKEIILRFLGMDPGNPRTSAKGWQLLHSEMAGLPGRAPKGARLYISGFRSAPAQLRIRRDRIDHDGPGKPEGGASK